MSFTDTDALVGDVVTVGSKNDPIDTGRNGIRVFRVEDEAGAIPSLGNPACELHRLCAIGPNQQAFQLQSGMRQIQYHGDANRLIGRELG